MALEIERKFLVKEFPKDLELIHEVDIWQGYISLSPEVRIHKAYDRVNGKVNYRLTVKGDGTLSRTEIKTTIDESFFEESLNLMQGGLIYKDYRSYRYKDYVLEVCNVDPETSHGFYYAEVEFESEEEANSFEKPGFLGKEVTDDDSYKMKNYWKQTRNTKK